MQLYKHILLAVDFYDRNQPVIDKAKLLAMQNQATLGLVHVLETLPMPDASYGPMNFDVDLAQQWQDASQRRLAKLGEELAVPEQRQWLEMGSAKLEIVRVAEENAIDLIVVGSHGRHGLGLLLGSTANGVLHHAKCDVLAVRLQDD